MASTDPKLSKDSLGRVHVTTPPEMTTISEPKKGGFPFNPKEGSNIKKAKSKGQKVALGKMY